MFVEWIIHYIDYPLMNIFIQILIQIRVLSRYTYYAHSSIYAYTQSSIHVYVNTPVVISTDVIRIIQSFIYQYIPREKKLELIHLTNLKNHPPEIFNSFFKWTLRTNVSSIS